MKIREITPRRGPGFALGLAAVLASAMTSLLLAGAVGGETKPPRCLGQPATIYDVSGRMVKGTPNADVIVAGGGEQEIFGFGGGDRICAGPGRDYVQSGQGGDRIRGDLGLDLIKAGGGRDRIWGEAGNDLLVGGGGRDQLRGDEGADRLNGKGGRDLCSGGPGADIAAKCEQVRGAEEL